LRRRRVNHVLAINVAHACSTHRAVERDTRQGQRSGSTDQRRNIRINFRVDRHHGRDDLHFIVKAFREQRTQRTVDQTRGQRFLLRRTAFTLEEATRDLAGGVGLFNIINGQREKILARLGVLGTDNGHQNDGVIIGDHDRTAGLTGHMAGFQGQGVGTVLNTFTCNFKHTHCFLFLSTITNYLTTTTKTKRALSDENARHVQTTVT